MKAFKGNIVILIIVFCVFTAVMTFAVPACPEAFKIKQPDGREFLARAFGDEWYSGMETAEGYTIFKEPLSGYWVYAKKASTGELYPSDLVVGYDSPGGIQKHLRDEVAIQMIPYKIYHPIYPEYVKGKKVTGELKALVILVEFTNQKLVGSKPLDWKKRVFGGSNSVKHYFREASYKEFSIVPVPDEYGTKNDGIIKVKIDMKHPNTGSKIRTKNQRIAKKALIAADKYVNYKALDLNKNGGISRYEAVFIIVCAGFEASYAGSESKEPNIWAHRRALWGIVTAPTLDGVKVADPNYKGKYIQIGEWHQGSNQARGHMATIGILCHEIGHIAGNLPDLYDTDYSSEGIGNWGLMGSGNWNKTRHPGDSPAHPTALSKYFMGWIIPTLLKQESRQYNASKQYSIKRIEDFQEQSCYLLGTNPNGAEYGGEGEYFLLENRQKYGYDEGLPGFGLLIWHIEESKSDNTQENNTKAKHPLVTLEQADGLNHLETRKNQGDKGDPFPGSKNKRKFTKTTNPNSKWYGGRDSKVSVTKISNSRKTMTTVLSGTLTPTLPQAPSNLEATTASSSQINLSWADNSDKVSLRLNVRQERLGVGHRLRQ